MTDGPVSEFAGAGSSGQLLAAKLCLQSNLARRMARQKNHDNKADLAFGKSPGFEFDFVRQW